MLHESGMPGPTGLPGDTQTGFANLIGGCPGGSDGTNGGGGGGAVQLVSFTNISIVGAVSVGGGGGNSQGVGARAGISSSKRRPFPSRAWSRRTAAVVARALRWQRTVASEDRQRSVHRAWAYMAAQAQPE